jgi:hypothetical protein
MGDVLVNEVRQDQIGFVCFEILMECMSHGVKHTECIRSTQVSKQPAAAEYVLNLISTQARKICVIGPVVIEPRSSVFGARLFSVAQETKIELFLQGRYIVAKFVRDIGATENKHNR